MSPTDKSRILVSVLPVAFGLGIAQGTFGATAYSTSAYNEHLFVPDPATILSSFIMVALIGALGLQRNSLKPRAASTLSAFGVILQVFSSYAIAGARILAPGSTEAAFAFSVCAAAGNALVISHWLRALRRASMPLVITATFSSMVVSEALCTVCAQLDHVCACAVVGTCSLLQIVLMRTKADISSSQLLPFADEKSPKQNYLEVARAQGYDPFFLLVSGTAIVVVSVTESILWGFPYGEPQAVSGLERFLCGCFAIAVLCAKVLHEATRSRGVLSTWLWLLFLGLLSLLSYTALPWLPALGLAFLVAFSDIATAYSWCIIIAFMEKGRYDPHAYALGGIVAFLFPGALARTAALIASSLYASVGGAHFPGDMALATVLSALIMAPVAIVLGSVANRREKEMESAKKASASLLRAFGLSGQALKPTDLRRAFLKESVNEMKESFNLSVRESEVLMLYALGFTQSKIAEELHISPNTAHSHISRIYTKTGLHSRQEIIDYLDTIAHTEQT